MTRRGGYIVRLRQHFQAPIEQVFRAWTDLDSLSAWTELEGWKLGSNFYTPALDGDAIVSFWSVDGRRNLEVVGRFPCFQQPERFRLDLNIRPSAGRPFDYFGHRLGRELSLSLDIRLEALGPTLTALDFLAVSPDARSDEVRAAIVWEQRVKRLVTLVEGSSGLPGH